MKEIIDKAFLKHENSIMQKICSNLQNFSHDESNMNSCLRNECLELIKKELKDVPDCNNQSNANNREECKKISEERIELDEYLGNKNNVKCEKETKDTIKIISNLIINLRPLNLIEWLKPNSFYPNHLI